MQSPDRPGASAVIAFQFGDGQKALDVGLNRIITYAFDANIDRGGKRIS